MRYVVGMLEGHWPARFVSIIYSLHCFRQSFFPTTWHRAFFSHAVKREDHVCQSRETYAMQVVVATVFWVLLFPHEGRIVTIDHLSFSKPDPALGESTVPMIDNPQPDVVNVGVGLCPSLMGTFDYPPPHDDIKFISNHHKVEIFQVSSFRMTYFEDPWILPSPSAPMDETGHLGMSMPLSATEVVYSLF
jgi:hypothetical protein